MKGEVGKVSLQWHGWYCFHYVYIMASVVLETPY